MTVAELRRRPAPRAARDSVVETPKNDRLVGDRARRPDARARAGDDHLSGGQRPTTASLGEAGRTTGSTGGVAQRRRRGRALRPRRAGRRGSGRDELKAIAGSDRDLRQADGDAHHRRRRERPAVRRQRQRRDRRRPRQRPRRRGGTAAQQARRRRRQRPLLAPATARATTINCGAGRDRVTAVRTDRVSRGLRDGPSGRARSAAAA